MADLEISVVIPLYNEDESLPELIDWLHRVLTGMGHSYEVILVDDGSRDNSWAVVQQLSTQYPGLRGLRLNRNYGKSAALDTGFRHARGRVVFTMDADLQDSPEELPELYDMIARQGYDLVSGWKAKRYDPFMKTAPSKLFNWVTSQMSGIKLHDFNCGLKAYNGRVVQTLTIYGEMHRYIPVLAKWNGFTKIGEKVVQHRARKYGVTKFGLERFLYGFLDLLSIMFVSRFRKRPMHFFGALGVLAFLLGTFISLWLIFEKLYYNLVQGIAVRNVTDQPLFFLALVSIIVGVQLFMAGFLGEMVVQVTSRRREYVVSENISSKNAAGSLAS